MDGFKESDDVTRLFREAMKLNERQRWYLAEAIADSIDHELVEAKDEAA